MPRKAQVYTLPDSGTRHLSEIDDSWLACKAARRHNMPKLLPGKIPGEISITAIRRGVYQITGRCRDCGLPGTMTTGPRGTIGTGWTYDYSKLKGYLAPRGAGLKAADYREEYGYRLTETLAAAAPAPPARKKPNGNQHATSPRARRTTRDGEKKPENQRINRRGQIPPATFSGSGQ